MDLILALLIANCNPNTTVELRRLASNIEHLAREHEVRAELLTRVIILESRCLEHAYNADTDDAGLMQINKVHGLSDTCLFAWECNLEHGAELLAQARRPCEFNLGRVGSIRHPEKCLQYENKLASISIGGNK